MNRIANRIAHVIIVYTFITTITQHIISVQRQNNGPKSPNESTCSMVMPIIYIYIYFQNIVSYIHRNDQRSTINWMRHKEKVLPPGIYIHIAIVFIIEARSICIYKRVNRWRVLYIYNNQHIKNASKHIRV